MFVCYFKVILHSSVLKSYTFIILYTEPENPSIVADPKQEYMWL